MGALIRIAVVALIVFVMIKLVRRTLAPAFSRGYRSDKPFRVGNILEMDAFVEAAFCASCGGGFRIVGEGPAEDHVRLVRVRCKKCDTERSLYFEIQAAG